MNSTDAQVIVIGAGLAGLATARALSYQKIDVLVLEARDRIGGRVFSHAMPNGAVVDMGAQMIGPRQLRINALATQAGAKLIRLNTKGRNIREPESSLSMIDRFHVARTAWRLHKEARATPAATPWKRKQAKELDSMSCSEWLASIASPGAANFWTKLAKDAFCIDPQAISALEALQHYSSMGGLIGLATAETSYLENGAGTLANYLADDLTVLQNNAVQSVEVSDEQVRIDSDNRSLYAKQAVLAVPPQVGCKMLSADQTEAIGYIEKSTHGNVVKTAIVYASAWWKNKGLSGFISSDIGPVSATFDCTPPGANYGCLLATSCADKASSLSQDEHTRVQSIVKHTDQLLDNTTHKPLFCKSINWNLEPESLGGFSSVREPGSWIKQACSPGSTQGPIHVAGTEFAVEWRSYMEGALESGERAAANVLKALKK